MKTGLIVLLFSWLILAQDSTITDTDTAYRNALKGIYWGLSNIPEKKASIDNDLISENKLVSSVKLNKELNGVKIQSTGYFNTCEVSVKIFRSDDFLLKEGYIKPPVKEEVKVEDQKIEPPKTKKRIK